MQNYAKERRIKGKRHYEVPTGGVYPSVTTVLSSVINPKLQSWIDHVGEAVASYARMQGAKRGEEFHTMTEKYLKGESLAEHKKLLPKALFDQVVPVLMGISNIQTQEEVLWSDELKIAGRVDCIADFDGVPAVIDFKTATKAKAEEDIQNYFQQATCYSLMYEERTGKKIDNIVIIISCESGEYQVITKNRRQYIESLKSIIEQYHATREIQNDILVE